MHKLNTFVAFCILAVAGIPVQVSGQMISFEKKMIRSTMGNYGYSVRETFDGGYIIAGATATDPRHGRPQVYLVKTNEYGDTLWTRLFYSGLSSSAYSIRQSSDGGYIIVGSNEYFGPFGNDFVAIRTDSVGREQWNKTYNIYFSDHGTGVQQTSDGGFIIAGYTDSSLAKDSCGVLIRINAFGDTAWTKSFCADQSITFNDILLIGDGGYLLAGSYADSAWIVRTDSTGNVLWSVLYGTNDLTYATSICRALDGDFIVAGFANQCAADSCGSVYLLKIDSVGTVLWQHPSLGIGNFYSSFDNPGNVVVQATSDSGYFLMSNRTIPYVERRVYLLKTNSRGDTVWTRLYGEAGGSTIANSAQHTSDGGFIITGTSDPALYLLKITADGLLAVGTNNDILPTESALRQNYPNPFNPNTQIEYSLAHAAFVTLKIYNLLGQEVATLVSEELHPGTYSALWDASGFASGVYYYRLQARSLVETKKLILLR